MHYPACFWRHWKHGVHPATPRPKTIDRLYRGSPSQHMWNGTFPLNAIYLLFNNCSTTKTQHHSIHTHQNMEGTINALSIQPSPGCSKSHHLYNPAAYEGSSVYIRNRTATLFFPCWGNYGWTNSTVYETALKFVGQNFQAGILQPRQHPNQDKNIVYLQRLLCMPPYICYFTVV